ncbi:MAG TPA: hypothetical protein VF582_08070 [Allosphingosinicella sp.]|jgi:hypothetical protein
MRRSFPLLVLLLVACGGGEGEQNAVELANVAQEGGNQGGAPADAAAAAGNSQAAAPEPKILTVGPVQVPYDASRLTAVRTKVQLPPDWKVQVEGTKLIGKDRAALLGKAECMYGQAGKATACNAVQEAGLAFADLEGGWIDVLRKSLPAADLKKITLGGVEGVSWQVGAEGEGAEHILLPVQEHTILIVRHFRNTGNPDEAALGEVLNGLELPE